MFMQFIITAATPRGAPLPVDSQARKPDRPEIMIPKPGMKIAMTEKMSEAMPKAIIILTSRIV